MSNMIVVNFCEGRVLLMCVKLETKGDKEKSIAGNFLLHIICPVSYYLTATICMPARDNIVCPLTTYHCHKENRYCPALGKYALDL